MNKGKYGLPLPLVAMVAFIFALLNQPLAILLIAGFALLAEKDEWLSHQAVQALLLSIIYNIIGLILDLIFGNLRQLLITFEAYDFSNVIGSIYDVISGLVFLVLAIFCILGIVRVLGSKDAGIPGLSKLASGDFAKPKRAPMPQQPPMTAPYPYAPQGAPQPYPPMAAAPSTRICGNCGSVLTGDSVFCPVCGTRTN